MVLGYRNPMSLKKIFKDLGNKDYHPLEINYVDLKSKELDEHKGAYFLPLKPKKTIVERLEDNFNNGILLQPESARVLLRKGEDTIHSNNHILMYINPCEKYAEVDNSACKPEYTEIRQIFEEHGWKFNEKIGVMRGKS